jgi:hypothetical protein
VSFSVAGEGLNSARYYYRSSAAPVVVRRMVVSGGLAKFKSSESPAPLDMAGSGRCRWAMDHYYYYYCYYIHGYILQVRVGTVHAKHLCVLLARLAGGAGSFVARCRGTERVPAGPRGITK